MIKIHCFFLVISVGWKDGWRCLELEHIFLSYPYIDGGCLDSAIQVAPFFIEFGEHQNVKW